jgi:hypothetical protein
MREVRPIHWTIRAPVTLTVAAAMALVLAGGAVRAQVGSLGPNPPLGMPGSDFGVGATGLPMGATELPDSGLSPAPPGVTLGTSPVAPNMPSTSMAVTGAGALGNGLGPNVSLPGSFAPAAPSFGITNFGTGGVQSLPGSPRSGSAGFDR